MTQDSQTLTQRIAAGRLPLADTLRYGLKLAEALRHMHDEGYCHGALTPDSVMLTPAGVELVPALPGAAEALTPYTAPERLKGQGPDTRTDIFAFGAILYEMLTGRHAFEGAESEALAESIANLTPPPIGNAPLDRLISNCLIKDPSGRWQRIQQIHMEIKILNFSASRAQAAATLRPPDALLQAELRRTQSRVTAQLEQHGEAMDALRQMAAQQSSALNQASETLGAVQMQVVSLEGKVAAAGERAQRAEQTASQIDEGARREAASLQVSLAGELHALELTVKGHAAAIDSMRGAMARTDDFMERVVEALESLQTMVLEQTRTPVEQA
jgi:eukaryotic-like serine/threonine-protein kinase